MDYFERMNDRETSFRQFADRIRTRIWTSLPGIVDSYDATDGTVNAHIALKGTRYGPNGKSKLIDFPPLYKLPVHFPGGGNVLCSFPIAKGDEILICFGARAIDNWWVRGGVQPQLEPRFTDIADSFCIPLIWSKPNVPPALSTTTAQLRSKNGDTYVELDATNQKVNVVAPGNADVTAPIVTVHGELRVTGAIIAGYGGADQVGVQTHVHNQPPDSASNTQAPTNAPTPGT